MRKTVKSLEYQRAFLEILQGLIRYELININELSFQVSSLELDEIYRNLLAYGFFIEMENYEEGRNIWRLKKGSKTKMSLNLSILDLSAILASYQVLGFLKGSFLFNSLENIARKIQKNFKGKILNFKEIEEIGENIFPQNSLFNFNLYQDLITNINLSIKNSNKILLGLKLEQGMPGNKNKLYFPFEIQIIDQNLYLVLFDPSKNGYEWVSIHRIEKYEVLSEVFVIHKNAKSILNSEDRKALIEKDFEVVKLKVKGWAKVYLLENIVHNSQKIIQNKDQSLSVYLRIPLNQELTSWILSMGSNCQVLGPPSLVQNIQREITLMSNFSSDQKLKLFG